MYHLAFSDDLIVHFLDVCNAKIKTKTIPLKDIIKLGVKIMLEDIKKHRFVHLPIYKNIILIYDRNVGKDGSYLRLELGKKNMNCLYCESINCVHVKYAWSQKDLIMNLRSHNLGTPF